MTTTMITRSELVNMLKEFRGASFVSVGTSTEPKMNKFSRVDGTPNPFLGRVTRVAQRAGMLGASYENAVNNRRENEGHDQAGMFRAEAMWNGAGEHVEGCRTLVRHRGTGKLYMVFYPRHDMEGQVQVSDSRWLLDGTENVSVKTLKPFLPPVSEGSRRQETERSVPWRVIAIENVVQLTMGKETFVVVG